MQLLVDFLSDFLLVPHGGDQAKFTLKVGPLTGFDSKFIENGILITDLPSIKSINYARKKKYNFIISPNSFSFLNGNTIDLVDQNRLLLLLKGHIMHYVLPSQWAWIQDGLNESLIEKIGLKKVRVIEQNRTDKFTGYGYICRYDGPKIKLKEFIRNLKRLLSVNHILLMGGNGDDTFSDNIFLSSSKITDLEHITDAHKNKCQYILSGSISTEAKFMALKYGIKTIETTYLGYIRPALEKLKLILSMQFPHLETENFYHYGLLNVF